MSTDNQKHEEILEAIWTTSENDKYSIAAIKKECHEDLSDSDLSKLEKRGLIVMSGDKILFTEDGKSCAEKIIRRHRLAEVLVHSILMLKDSKMEEIACKVEHTLLPEIEESICTLLGHPETCPDGRSIPRGRCCGKSIKAINNMVVSLNELKSDESAKVMYIRPGNHAQLHQLLSFGLNPGVIVTVHHHIPTFCIKFENTELALDEEIVKNIFVLKIMK